MGITCCKDCIAPKRHIGCHEVCLEYLSEKKKHDEMKEKRHRWLKLEGALYAQRERGIQKALRSRRK